MRAVLAGICFLAAFIATGNSLECVQCHSYEQPDCTGELITCPDSATECKTAISYLKYEGRKPNQHIFKGCSENKEQNYIYKEKVIGIYYKLKVKTCRGNGCNRDPLHYSPRNTTLNGVKCPTCYVENALSCEPSGEPVQCTGELTHCIYVAGTAHISAAPAFNTAFRGCTNIKDVLQFPDFPGEILTDIQTLQLTHGV